MPIVECPLCLKMISNHRINHHIDLECMGSGETKRPRRLFPQGSKVQLQIQLSSSADISATASTSVSSKSELKDGHLRKSSPASTEQQSKPILTSRIHTSNKRKRTQDTIPLAERSRPTRLEDLKGQPVLRSSGLFLPNLIASQKIPNMIFFGPPGSGKTSAARMIGNLSHLYFEYSATIHHLQDIRQGVEKAIKHLLETGQKGVVFIDEIHRFSKAQQDVFLQSVERGEYIFLAATTENPSFRVNNALLSRCRVYPFQKLDVKDIMEIIDRGITFLLPTPSDQISDLPLINPSSLFTDDMKTCIAAFSDGDGRVALNALEQLWYTFQAAKTPPSLESIKKSLTRSGTLYDRDGEEHYNIISALHKSMRGSDENAALYWLGRMIYAGEDPLYVARRLIRFASEDIGLANNQALDLAVSTYQSCQMIGMPECDVILAHCVAYLAQSPKSVQVYKAMKRVKLVISQESNYPVPLHLRNAPTPLMKDLDYGKGYKYNPDYQEPVQQTYLPPDLQTKRFFE